MAQGLAYWIDTGEFKDDRPDGKVCQYCGGSLCYDGGMKDGEKSGDGKGTMYAEDGSELYSGRWRDGDYD